MTKSDAFWASLVLTGTAYELHALHTDPKRTLSPTIRRGFRCHSKVGRWAFRVGWMGFASWFLFHIASEAIEQAIDLDEQIA